jgi:hypothetical protein
MSKRYEAGLRELVEILRHALLVSVVLSFWIITAWWIDKILLKHLPLEGMSIISFRFLELGLHISTLRLVYRLLFPSNDHRQFRWWV